MPLEVRFPPGTWVHYLILPGSFPSSFASFLSRWASWSVPVCEGLCLLLAAWCGWISPERPSVLSPFPASPPLLPRSPALSCGESRGKTELLGSGPAGGWCPSCVLPHLFLLSPFCLPVLNRGLFSNHIIKKKKILQNAETIKDKRPTEEQGR